MKTAKQFQTEYRAIKEEMKQWKEQKPQARHLRPDQYENALNLWHETFDSLADMASGCVAEFKAQRKAA